MDDLTSNFEYLYLSNRRDYNSWQSILEREKRLVAVNFMRYFKRLLNGRDSIQISINDLYENHKYPTSINISGIPNAIPTPHEIAKSLGMLSINDTTRPYIYSLKSPMKKEKIELRDYQRDIIEQAGKHNESVLIEAPTGSGKSVMACEIAKNETLNGGIVLIVAPKIILMDQLKETFTELDPQIIHGPKDYDTTHNVFISTIQTAHKRDLGFEPTMILIDEVHIGFTGKMIKQLLKEFTGKVVGLSATPYDQNGMSIQGFKKHINEYDLAYMLKCGYLVYPHCFAPVKVDLKPISIVAGDYNQSELDQVFNNIESIINVVDATKEKLSGANGGLVFCINIAHAEAMAKAFSDAGIPSAAIHSKLTKDEQDQIMRRYKTRELKLLANPMMLTTGFDDPSTDCVILARPTRSQNLYRQMIGRALRPAEGKFKAIILDCGGVIEDLGMPTHPITPKLRSITQVKRVCNNCQSDQIYRRIIKNHPYQICAKCGQKEDIEVQGIECNRCGLIHMNQSTYVTKEDTLYLVCDECSFETPISTNTAQSELRALFDQEAVLAAQKNCTKLTVNAWIENFGPEYILREAVHAHLKALHTYIRLHPEHFIGVNSIYDLMRIEPFSESKMCEYGEAGHWMNTRDSYGWRVFGEQFENEQLYEGLNSLNESLRNTDSFYTAMRVIRQIETEKGEILMDQGLEKQIQRELENSKIKNIGAMANKRLKDLYFKGQDLHQMRGFVEIMEGVFGL